jgi:hypothetical protein
MTENKSVAKKIENEIGKKWMKMQKERNKNEGENKKQIRGDLD